MHPEHFGMLGWLSFLGLNGLLRPSTGSPIQDRLLQRLDAAEGAHLAKLEAERIRLASPAYHAAEAKRARKAAKNLALTNR